MVAISALWANKLRAILTTLGIIIGVMAVIAVVSIIQGLSKYITDFFMDLGSNTLWVVPHRPHGKEGEKLGRIKLTVEDANAIAEKCPSITNVTPQMYESASIRYQGQVETTSILGVSERYQEINNYYVEYGRFITPMDIKSRKRVAVIGSSIPKMLDTKDDLLNQYIKLNNRRFFIIGVMENRGSFFGESRDELILIPYSTMEKIYGKRVSKQIVIIANVKPNSTVEAAKEEIRLLLRSRHNLSSGQPNDFRIATQDQILQEFKKISSIITGVAAGIVSIALLVGGIGIMNIMLVSVTERTREIGIRKSVGAKTRDIMFQFLVESVTLSIFGGIIGIIIGYLVGMGGVMALSKYTGVQMPAAYVPIWAIVLGFCFSAGVGLFFGIYPAMKAARLDPIEALRYE